MNSKPLDGIKVIDLTHVLAGPYCTYQLGLLGADVIKVESPKGDMVRGWGGSDAQLQHRLGSGFVPQNAGKRSIVIDIQQTRGAELVRELIVGADVFVENYRPGTMNHHGLDFETLKTINPNLIYVSISAMGHTGPARHRPGFDDVVQATSGFMSINVRGDGPIRTGGPVLDYATGMQAASAVLAAILQRQQTGEGQHIDIAMQDVTLLLMNRNTSISATTGNGPAPGSNKDGPLLGRYKTADGYVMLAGYLPTHICSILIALDLAQYADFGTRELYAQIEDIEVAVEQRLLQKTSADWDAIFSENGIVAGGVQNLDDVVASEQIESRELVTEVDSAIGVQRVTTAGYRLNDEVFSPQGGVPLLGEHTSEILHSLGYTDNDIHKLKADGCVS